MYSKMLSLRFPKDIVDEPVVVNLVREFALSFNILKATIYPRKEGLMVLELSGHKKNNAFCHSMFMISHKNHKNIISVTILTSLSLD